MSGGGGVVLAIPSPVTGQQVLAKLYTVNAATASSVDSVAPPLVRPVGLSVALSQSVSSFIQSAKITRPAGVRSTNAMFFS